MHGRDEAYSARLGERVAEVTLQRTQLLRAIEDMRQARRLTVADDEHDPEGSTVSLDQARDDALLARAEHSLTELAAAQARLATGAYGCCETCGEMIPDERLAARPEVRRCVGCAGAGRGRSR